MFDIHKRHGVCSQVPSAVSNTSVNRRHDTGVCRGKDPAVRPGAFQAAMAQLFRITAVDPEGDRRPSTSACVFVSIIPHQWKHAVICPVPKIASPHEESDYRPISITPVLSKLLERIVVRQFLYPAIITPPTPVST